MKLPGVYVITNGNPCHYHPAQIEKACKLAWIMGRGKLVLLEEPGNDESPH